MDNLPIIDPHHHLYDLKSGRYPWLQDEMLDRVFGDYSAIRKDYLIDDFRADIKNQNVVKSVHLQVEYDHNDPVAETRWLQSVADEHGYPNGIVAFADLASRGRLVRTFVWLRVPNLANDLLWLRLESALPAIVSAVHDNDRIFEVF